MDCIDKGQCPHVSNADAKYVTEARLSALHVIAASGTSETLGKHRKFRRYRLGGYLRTFAVFNGRQPIGRLEQCRSLKPDGESLLSLTPFDIAVLKNRHNVSIFGRNFYVNLPILLIIQISKSNLNQCL